MEKHFTELLDNKIHSSGVDFNAKQIQGENVFLKDAPFKLTLSLFHQNDGPFEKPRFITSRQVCTLDHLILGKKERKVGEKRRKIGKKNTKIK